MALQSRPKSLASNPFFLIFIGWLIPGAGFFFLERRNWLRGAIFFVVIHLTFVLGVLLKGGVVWPIWITNPGFSILNDLTFVVQLGAGWPALVSLLAYFRQWNGLAAVEVHALYEIGSFYCLVCGAMNYFIIIQCLERSKKKAFEMLAKQ